MKQFSARKSTLLKESYMLLHLHRYAIKVHSRYNNRTANGIETINKPAEQASPIGTAQSSDIC